jgi:hypothetical protein
MRRRGGMGGAMIWTQGRQKLLFDETGWPTP